MARKRKSTQAIRESSMREEEEEEGEEIPMEEQVRLIEQSGVLQLRESEDADPPDELAQSAEKPGLGDEVFDTTILLIPFLCLYIGMDVYVSHLSTELVTEGH
jgi:hypothetical protein